MDSLHELRSRYEDPSEKDSTQFAAYQSGFNEAQLSRVRMQLDSQQIINSVSRETGLTPDQISLALVGSDGRGEKGLSSTMEMIAIVSGDNSIEVAIKESARRAINNILRADDGGLFHPKGVEVKSLLDKDISFYTEKDFRIVMPSRTLDSRFVTGNAELVKQLKVLLVDELRSEQGRRVLDDFNLRQKRSRKVLLSGSSSFQGAPQIHYDLAAGVSNYDPTAHISGFKLGPLRLIQQRVVLTLIHIARHMDPEGAKRLFADLPNGTVEKLYFLLSEQKMGPYAHVADLSSLYTYFLWQYAISEHEYVKKGQTQTPFDVKDVSERLNAVSRIERELADSSRRMNVDG